MANVLSLKLTFLLVLFTLRIPFQLFEESCSQQDSQDSHSAVISSSVHDLSPTLWHALDVWRCVHHLAGGLKDAVQALGACGQGLAAENWSV